MCISLRRAYHFQHLCGLSLHASFASLLLLFLLGFFQQYCTIHTHIRKAPFWAEFSVLVMIDPYQLVSKWWLFHMWLVFVVYMVMLPLCFSAVIWMLCLQKSEPSVGFVVRPCAFVLWAHVLPRSTFYSAQIGLNHSVLELSGHFLSFWSRVLVFARW